MKKTNKVKKRDYNIVLMAQGFFKPQVIKNKKKYSRKMKHKKSLYRD